VWGNQNPHYQDHFRDYRRYHYLPKAQANPNSKNLHLGYVFWQAITWGAAILFLYFFLKTNGSRYPALLKNNDYLVGKITCAISALLLVSVGCIFQFKYRSAMQQWRVFDQASQRTTGMIIGKWTQATPNLDGL
jgi:hypothetical protein